jgi:hypothetical protein
MQLAVQHIAHRVRLDHTAPTPTPLEFHAAPAHIRCSALRCARCVRLVVTVLLPPRHLHSALLALGVQLVHQLVYPARLAIFALLLVRLLLSSNRVWLDRTALRLLHLLPRAQLERIPPTLMQQVPARA